MIKLYDLDYHYDSIAQVEIDDELATPYIKEMVEFWMNWEDRLEYEAKGDYIICFLQQLTKFAIRNSRIPNENDEGWMIGKQYGIEVVDFTPYEISYEYIDIECLGEYPNEGNDK